MAKKPVSNEPVSNEPVSNEPVSNEPVSSPDDLPANPEWVVLASPYGFIDADGKNWYWHSGQKVTDPEEISLLVQRKANLEQ